MPRNGQGVYSLPPVYEAVTGETIEAQQHNVPLVDIAADLNQPRSVATGGTGGASAQQARDNINVYSKTETDQKIESMSSGAQIKETPIDADGVVISDSSDSGKPKRVLWSRIKAVLKSYFDGLYASLLGATFIGDIRVRYSASHGYAQLNSGSPSLPGFVAFYSPDGLRRGFVGSGDDGYIVLQGDNGWGFKIPVGAEFKVSGSMTIEGMSRIRRGTAFQQSIMNAYGWSSGFDAWRTVLEADEGLAFYSYNPSSGVIRDRCLSISANGDGAFAGVLRVSGGNQVVHAGNIGAQNVNYANTANRANSAVYADRVGNGGWTLGDIQWAINNAGGNMTANGIGCVALLQFNDPGSNIYANSLHAGSGLSMVSGSALGGAGTYTSWGPAGTWRYLGPNYQAANAGSRCAGIFVRVS